MRYKANIRDKLIGIFILIKVIPLIVLSWFAWNEIVSLSGTLEGYVNEMAGKSKQTTEQVADLAATSSIRALDIRSREAIEHLTTDTARNVAAFLNARDADIRMASMLKPGKTLYTTFITAHKRDITRHTLWILNKETDAWEPRHRDLGKKPSVKAGNKDNQLDFHYRNLSGTGLPESTPMYLEMTYVDITGMEKIKVLSSGLLSDDLRDISKKDQTFCKAETYYKELVKLQPGEIYVSDVIGAYVKTHMIGPYNRKRAEKMGIEFTPEQSGYAGKENPVGKRFQGLIRWAMPVVDKGIIQGYVTLALDHTHVMEFTDHIVPTQERYTAISDAASGNYAFMWDYKGRNISHPRDYFIVGYDPVTGEPAVPWLIKQDYDQFLTGNLRTQEFLETLPTFENQALSVLPSKKLIKKGLVALDCRYLNFAPQCSGWNNLTQFGGSGSFVIHWSGLKKLTTAAAIPYFTGQYSQSPRGFGFVTIGANVDEFHKPAMTTATTIKLTEKQYIQTIEQQSKDNRQTIVSSLHETATRLTAYTVIMVFLVIVVAVWMASALTGKITTMIKGISRFQKGDIRYRLDVQSSDEIGELTQTFNSMADTIQEAISKLEQSKSTAENSNISLKAMLSKIIDSMPSIIIGIDTRAKITLWNSEARKITGQKFKTVAGKNIFDVFPLLKKEKSIVFPALAQGKIKKEERLEIISNNERELYDVTVYPLINDKIDGAVLRIDNITARVQMEEAMLQSEKMLSVGGLAAGMAHEINNPLAGIMQNTQLALNRLTKALPANDKAATEAGTTIVAIQDYIEKRKIVQLLDNIHSAGSNAAKIVENMLSFAKKGDTSKSSHNAQELFKKTIDLAQSDYDLKRKYDFKKIKVVNRFESGPFEIICEKSKILQVFFNIIKNAAQEMHDSEQKPEGPVLIFRLLRAGHMAQIEIEDNGPGMDEAVRKRVFEPFFTTKDVDKGTGLGLSLSYFIIVDDHGGEMEVESTPGKGTKFIIRLPLDSE